ncbi:hypothetical protein J7K93_02340 [bacterium]|nr:hypothetical protein [bacterium]
MKKIIPIIAVILSGMYCAHINEAELAFQQKDYKKTIHLCRISIENDSLNTDAMRLLSRSYVATDSLINARKMAKRAFDIDTDLRKNIKVLAYVLSASGDKEFNGKNYDYALKWYNDAAEICSTDTRIIRKKADTMLKLHFLDQAQKEYSRLISAGKDTSEIKKILKKIDEGKKLAFSYYKKGLRNLKRGSIVSAAKYFKKAVGKNYDLSDARYYFLLTSGKVSLKSRKKKKLWEAIESFGKAANLHPDSAEPHYFMAKAYERKDSGEFVNAIDEYKKALDLEPNGPYAKKCSTKVRTLSRRKKKLDDFWSRGRKKIKSK